MLYYLLSITVVIVLTLLCRFYIWQYLQQHTTLLSSPHLCTSLTIIWAKFTEVICSCRYTSLLAVGVGLIPFLLTSFSDPGIVKADNVSRYVSACPYDNVINFEKECSTCQIRKPARSKHCSVCDRCVARFDHHCGWMNNCIGEKNTRYFMAFLLWHFFLCVWNCCLKFNSC